MTPHLHFRRFEFKYHLPAAIADQIIPKLKEHMIWDPNANDDAGYIVNSLYLDSPDFQAYHDKIDGLMKRKKLRVRTYNQHPHQASAIFLEIKRKNGPIILKDRIVINQEQYQQFTANPFSLTQVDKSNLTEEFLYEYSSKQMQPTAYISYCRKPFFAKYNPDFRVTLDYNITSTKTKSWNPIPKLPQNKPDIAILEVKFNGALPHWFHAIIEEYRLVKDIYSKYCTGIEQTYGLPKYF